MIENLITFGKVLIEWGFWMVIYGLATMVIGALILLVFKKPIVKFIKALS